MMRSGSYRFATMTDEDRQERGSPATVVLVRHGHVPGIVPPSFRGRADLQLTSHGIRQAELTRDYLAYGFQPSVAYASPLSRCMRTAEIIAEPHPIAVVPLPAFIDIDYGDWQGRTFEQVRRLAPEAFSDWVRMPELAAIPNGENLADVAARVSSVMHVILSRHRGETVFLVGHDSVNRVFLALALELSLSRYWHLHQDPCGVSLLTYSDRGWAVRSINETAHMAPLRTVR